MLLYHQNTSYCGEHLKTSKGISNNAHSTKAISLYTTLMNQILKLAVELAVNSHTTAVPEFPLYDLVAQHNGNVMCPVPMCWDHLESRFFLHLITKTKHWNRKYVNSCLGRQQKGTKFNPLKGELTPHWTQPLSSNIGLLNIRGPVTCKNALGEFLYNLLMCHTSVEVKRAYI